MVFVPETFKDELLATWPVLVIILSGSKLDEEVIWGSSSKLDAIVEFIGA